MPWRWIAFALLLRRGGRRSFEAMPLVCRGMMAEQVCIRNVNFAPLSSRAPWTQNRSPGKFLEEEDNDLRDKKEAEEEEEEDDDDDEDEEGTYLRKDERLSMDQRLGRGNEKECGGLKAGILSKDLMKLPRDASAIPCLEQFISENRNIPKNVVVVALTNLKRSRRYKQALEVTEFFMKKNLFEIEDVDHMYRLYLVAQIGSIHDVEDCFEAIPARFLTERVYNQLIAFYIRKGMLKNAEIVLEKLKSSLDIISVRPYNQFMSMYRHQGHTKKALELIEAMNGSHTSPDTRTYNLLLSLISKQGDPDGVLKNYKTMKDEGVAPNIVTYSLVAKAYVSVGRLDEALSLAMEMKKLKGRNAHLAHDLLLTVYAEQGKYDDLRKLWKEVERSRNLSARSFGIMIESLGKLGCVKEAEILAAKAVRKKMKLPGKVYNALMDVYGRHGMIEAAERLMGRISSANSVTYKHLISGYLKQDQFDKALEYLRTSRNSLTYSNSKPWFESLMLIMENLAERGEYEIAEHAFRYFTSPGSHRNTSIYNVLIKAYIKARKATPSLSFQQRMFADGVEPDAKTRALLAEWESLHETING